MTKLVGSFLERRVFREASKKLTGHIVFGLGVSLAVTCFGGYKYYLDIEANNIFWYTVLWSGWGMFGFCVILPSVWGLPERALHELGSWIGHKAMIIILTGVYILLIWPAGILLRQTRGSHPIYKWESTPPSKMIGWQVKKYTYEQAFRGMSTDRKLKISFLRVITFFVRHGLFIFIPALILILSLGIVLFFLQTSVLAPFVYTLF